MPTLDWPLPIEVQRQKDVATKAFQEILDEAIDGVVLRKMDFHEHAQRRVVLDLPPERLHLRLVRLPERGKKARLRQQE